MKAETEKPLSPEFQANRSMFRQFPESRHFALDFSVLISPFSQEIDILGHLTRFHRNFSVADFPIFVTISIDFSVFLGEDRWILSLFLLISPFCFGILCTSFFTEKLPNLTYGLNQIFEILLWNILHIIFSRLPFCFGIPLHIIKKREVGRGGPMRIEYSRRMIPTPLSFPKKGDQETVQVLFLGVLLWNSFAHH